jgi:cation:H+ antiporter
LSRIDGALLVIWFIGVMLVIARTGRDIVGESDDDDEHKSRPLLRLIGGLAMLSIGGEILSDGIRGTVLRFGVSQTLLGNTVIAASVEVEEVARVALPAKRGRSDVAVGNIIGTVAHFIAFNAGVIALVKPLELDNVTLHLHLPIAAASVPLICLLFAVRSRISRLEGTALLLIYVAYIAPAILAA